MVWNKLFLPCESVGGTQALVTRTEELPNSNCGWKVSAHLRQAVDVSLVDKLIMRRVCATLMDAEQVLIGHVC